MFILLCQADMHVPLVAWTSHCWQVHSIADNRNCCIAPQSVYDTQRIQYCILEHFYTQVYGTLIAFCLLCVNIINLLIQCEGMAMVSVYYLEIHFDLKMLGLYLYTLIIVHKSCNMLSILNKLISQKLQNL